MEIYYHFPDALFRKHSLKRGGIAQKNTGRSEQWPYGAWRGIRFAVFKFAGSENFAHRTPAAHSSSNRFPHKSE
jgi:hypothetical protein